MSDMLLGLSSEFLYFHKKPPKSVSDLHRPYFLAFCPGDKDIESERMGLIKKLETNTSEETLSNIQEIGEVENYRSFWDFNKNRKVFRVYTKKSYFVPEVSNYLFFNHGLYTAEHDIPYYQRALIDLSAQDKTWVLTPMV